MEKAKFTPEDKEFLDGFGKTSEAMLKKDQGLTKEDHKFLDYLGNEAENKLHMNEMSYEEHLAQLRRGYSSWIEDSDDPWGREKAVECLQEILKKEDLPPHRKKAVKDFLEEIDIKGL